MTQVSNGFMVPPVKDKRWHGFQKLKTFFKTKYEPGEVKRQIFASLHADLNIDNFIDSYD
jgi:hypothetical protein